jgi:hypothetical protein
VSIAFSSPEYAVKWVYRPATNDYARQLGGTPDTDAATGQLFAKRKLVSGVWFIALATVPKELVPSGQVEAITK